jgi:hypothetical protein
MSQTSICIDPLSTTCVLKNMSLAIDEIKIVRSINRISAQVEAQDATQLDSGRRRYLLTELRFLNKRLQAVREKAELD